jgi:hypothetical protein
LLRLRPGTGKARAPGEPRLHARPGRGDGPSRDRPLRRGHGRLCPASECADSLSPLSLAQCTPDGRMAD